MAKGGFFLILLSNGDYKYEDGDYHGTKVKPRIFNTWAQAHETCLRWKASFSDYDRTKAKWFIARVGDKVCAEFVDKKGHRIVWSDDPGHASSAGYGETVMRIK